MCADVINGRAINPLHLFCTELYEGLKRAQRGRLEDQRGTDINFELPDFLKVSQTAS